jgi:DNA-directed RNA polymerase specialized sigma24 family protein
MALHRALTREPGRFASPEHARNYFLRAVHNLALKSRRDGGREEPLERDPPASDEDGAALQAVVARQEALGRILRELDGPSRELIARRFLEHHTLARIAAETGVPVSTLHDRERALVRELQRRLRAVTGEDGREEVG